MTQHENLRERRYDAEVEAACTAVRVAARACRKVQRDLVSAATLEKKDRSPVTVADYASQALVCAHLRAAFPADPIVAEEGTALLREPAQAPILSAVTERIAGGLGEATEARLASVSALTESGAVDEAQALSWIDEGSGTPRAGGRFWTLDPIDGTKGFLRGEHYAIALALIEDGRVVLGVLGCPNLPREPEGDPGTLLVSVRGQGAAALTLWDDGPVRAISVEPVASAREACFVESVESAHSDQSASAAIAERLGISREPVRIDSQVKYAAVARGEASIYLRLPTRADYEEKIWDHAAGSLLVEEAGGRVTDARGERLDFRQGRTLAANRGIIATAGRIHDEVTAAVRAVLQ